jgi:hypothetical protein
MSAVSESICNGTYEAEQLGRSFCWVPVALAALEVPEPGWRAAGINSVVNGEDCGLFKHKERSVEHLQASDDTTTAEVMARWQRRDLECWLAFARA